MFKKLIRKKAVSTIEYIALIVILLSAYLVMQRYVIGGFAGRWKSVGDSFGYGRQYDPAKTTECLWSEADNKWYNPICNTQACTDQCNY